MARTIAGQPFSAGNAFQGASDTIASGMAIQNENERHDLFKKGGEQRLSQEAEAFEMDKEQFRLNVQRMHAQAEAEQLETQIRLEERDRLKQEASVQQHILQGAMRPEKAQEMDPALLEGANARQTEQFGAVLAAGRQMREQTELAFNLGKRVTMELGKATVGTGDAPYMPGYPEGLQQLQEQLMMWQPGAGDPQELVAQFQELQQANAEFQIQHDATQAALEDLKTQYGGGPEFSVARAMVRAGKLDEAADEAYRTKHPEAWKKTREDAQNELILDVQRELGDQFLSLALEKGWDPGSEEWNSQRAKFYGAAREVYGEDFVPLSAKEQAAESAAAYAAAGISREEADKAMRAGLSVEEYQASQPQQRPLKFARPPKGTP